MAKKPGPPKGTGGRPIKPIDWVEAERLALMQCTQKEIASWYHVTYETLVERYEKEFGSTFSSWYEKHSANGKSSLRRRMYKAAMDGNVTMMIWLSKQMLGMRDRIDEVTDQKPVIIRTKDGVQVTLGTSTVDLKKDQQND
jgi:hypothetical protein